VDGALGPRLWSPCAPSDRLPPEPPRPRSESSTRSRPRTAASASITPSPPGHYFVLLAGPNPALVATPRDLRPPGPDAGALDDDLARSGAAFFLVQAIPESAPRDADGDGLDDLYELGRRPLLDPLDPLDARQDPDGDGLTSLEEYLRGTDPGTANALVTTFTSSPAAGEADVAVTRETTLDFSAPLAPGLSVGTNAVYAEFGGRRLLSRLQLASDRRKASLFFLENLPGSARVQVTVDGDLLPDAANRPLDADRDGRPGGRVRFHFDTVNLTPAPRTAVIGQVFASELAGVAGGPGVNRPLAGVTVTVDGREQDLRAVTDADGRFVLSPRARRDVLRAHRRGARRRTAPGRTVPTTPSSARPGRPPPAS
jgi:hypothetical protein